MRVRRVLIYPVAAAVAIIIGIGYLSFGRWHTSPKTAALLLNLPKALPPFSLKNDGDASFANTDLEGHWSLLYFGYTHCPDICPTTMAELDKMLGQLKNLPAAKQPHVYFISVDPKRDSPALLKQYVHYFNSDFSGVTGDVDQLRALTKPMGVAFSYELQDPAGNYTVDHSAVVFLINPEGKESAIFTPPMIPERIATDFRTIIDYHGAH